MDRTYYSNSAAESVYDSIDEYIDTDRAGNARQLGLQLF